MKVLKFGSASLATAERLEKAIAIINSLESPAVVVTAALDGVTDSLLMASGLASRGDGSFKQILSGLRERHIGLMEELCARPAKAAGPVGGKGLEGQSRGTASCLMEAHNSLSGPLGELDELLDKLERICEGLFILRVLPPKSLNEILSFGERLSALILASAIPGAVIHDSTKLIKTRRLDGKDVVASEQTSDLVREALGGGLDSTAIVPGFIASDLDTGETTVLGRGGSDLSASLVAAALEADELELWTDVDGFTTADPKAVKTAYVIEELSYREAMELCNFGVLLIYPPALYPVHSKGIPTRIKNISKPLAAGTTIKPGCKKDDKVIRGISSIDGICLLTLSGTSMAGLVGVDGRIFTVLGKEGISAFFVSQSASETGISIGVGKADAKRAKKSLDLEFGAEIASGSLLPVELKDGLAAVAVIGEMMKHVPGTAGKLFSTLGRSGISVVACTQDSSESNISFIIESGQLSKALNVIHDSFFLSAHQELNLFICGVGTVGSQLLDQLARQREKLLREQNLKLNIVGVARSTKGVFDREGIDPGSWKEAVAAGMDLTPERLKEEIIGMNIFNSVFVDCTASEEIAALYNDLLDKGVSVVAANKIAASSDFSNYLSLKETSHRSGVKFLFETNVGAGLPIIRTIGDLRNSGDRILKIEAVLSGTLNFIFNTISAEIPFSKAVRMAKEQGFSEPDPRIDLSGKDVIRKLVILSREAGYKVSQEDVKADLFIPSDFFKCGLEEFWAKLPSLDEGFERRRAKLEETGKRWRFVAKMEDGGCSVSLREVPSQHSFYVLDGSNNIVLLTTERYDKHPMLIQGYGAGASVTAAGVFADIMSIANVR